MIGRAIKKLMALVALASCTTSSTAFEKYVIEKYGTKDHGWHRPTGLALENPVPSDPGSLERGHELYQLYCSVCHGPEGRGDGPAAADKSPPPANLQNKADHRSDYHVYLQISLGRQGMPLWSRELSERDRWDLVNFVQSLPSRGS